MRIRHRDQDTRLTQSRQLGHSGQTRAAHHQIRGRERVTHPLRQELHLPIFTPPLPYCTDNAAMIAGLAFPLLQKNKTATLALETVATV